MALKLPVEMSKSRTGKHAARSLIVIVGRDGSTRVITRPEEPDRSVATYSVGQAGWARVSGDYAVLFHLVKGPSGRISGEVKVYAGGEGPVLEMVLRKRKLRRRRGRRDLEWVVEAAVKAIGLDSHIRKINMRTGEEA